MDRTGQGLVDFWPKIAEQGLMNPNTAGSYKNACETILGVQPDWRSRDVLTIDEESVINDFRAAEAAHYSDQTVQTYESNFRRAVPSFRDYLKDPDSWVPPVKARRSSMLVRKPVVQPVARAASRQPEELAIQLTKGKVAQLVLPADLTAKDLAMLKELLPIYLNQVDTVSE